MNHCAGGADFEFIFVSFPLGYPAPSSCLVAAEPSYPGNTIPRHVLAFLVGV